MVSTKNVSRMAVSEPLRTTPTNKAAATNRPNTRRMCSVTNAWNDGWSL